MRFELIVEAQKEPFDVATGVSALRYKFYLKLRNVDRNETVTLLDGNSMEYLKRRGSDLFDAENPSVARRINWCDGDDPLYDSTEYFTL